jgi:hypothetical protein
MQRGVTEASHPARKKCILIPLFFALFLTLSLSLPDFFLLFS